MHAPNSGVTGYLVWPSDIALCFEVLRHHPNSCEPYNRKTVVRPDTVQVPAGPDADGGEVPVRVQDHNFGPPPGMGSDGLSASLWLRCSLL